VFTTRMNAEAFHALTRRGSYTGTLARLASQSVNRLPGLRNGLRVRVWRALRPRRGRFLAGPSTTIVLAWAGESARVADWLPPAPSRKRQPGHDSALVWRALLAVGAVRNRAELAKWRGISRAYVTQVLGRYADSP
jgi:hypothetical protein